jgi:hypothetical protein
MNDLQTEILPADQGEENKIGPGHPPRQYQWQPGQSGNPDGPKVRRTNLWVWICKYLELTEAEFNELDRLTLTMAQLSALTMVEQMKKGERCPSEKLVEYCVNRDLGKTPDRHEVLQNPQDPEPFKPGERELLSELAKQYLASQFG